MKINEIKCVEIDARITILVSDWNKLLQQREEAVAYAKELELHVPLEPDGIGGFSRCKCLKRPEWMK